MDRPGPRLAATACVLLWCVTAEGALEGRARVALHAGVDSNARRDFDSELPVADATSSLTGAVGGDFVGERGYVRGDYDLGARKFFQYRSEDSLAQEGGLEGSLFAGLHSLFGLEGRVKDRRGADRDYSDLSAFAFAEFFPDDVLNLRVRAGARRFVYWANFPYSYGAGEGGVAGRYWFNRRHGLTVEGEAGQRGYNSAVDRGSGTSIRRGTFAWSAQAGYLYRGRVSLSASYRFREEVANTAGWSSFRHRLEASGGTRLPWKLFLFLQAVVQLHTYPEGVYLGPDTYFTLEEENQSSVSAKLGRPVAEHVDLELKYALYWGRMAGAFAPGSYSRHVGLAGVAVRW